MYDLLIKGGRVIDPSQNVDGTLDVAIAGDKIAAVHKDVPVEQSKRVIDARGKVVTPGLIDIHCHVARGIHAVSAAPDAVGVNQGVTTVADGGSTGAGNFAGFPKEVIPSSRTRVFCFLNLISLGLTIPGELRGWDKIDPEATAAVIDSHRGLIKGIKMLLFEGAAVSHGIKTVEVAQKVAKQFGMPVIIHVGDTQKRVSPTLTQELLAIMRPGDILSHIYTPNYGGLLGSDGALLPGVKAAMDRGVVMDTALGGNNFSFAVARKSIAQGVLPTTISDDVSDNTLKQRVYGMTVTMTKFMALGFELTSIVRMSTTNPARVLGEDNRIGSLKPGMEADVSVLEVLSGKWKLEDSEQQTVEVDRLITPSMTVRAGQVIPAQSPLLSV